MKRKSFCFYLIEEKCHHKDIRFRLDKQLAELFDEKRKEKTITYYFSTNEIYKCNRYDISRGRGDSRQEIEVNDETDDVLLCNSSSTITEVYR